MAEIVSSQSPDAEYLVTAACIRYSSWSARIVTLLEHFSIPHRLVEHNKADPSGFKAIKSTPAGWVPALTVPSLSITIHDSLAIAEFLAESHPTLPLWPHSRRLRALARSIVAEFHSGFGNLRNTYHSNFVARYTGDVPITPGIQAEVARLLQIFEGARKETLGDGVEGAYLYGAFGIADAFYWPVLWRLRTYNVDLSAAGPLTREWIKTMWRDPVLRGLEKRMFIQARDPQTKVPEYDDIFPGVAKMEVFEEGVEYEPVF